MALVLNQLGLPEPPTEIVRRLKQIHPAFGLKFYRPAAASSLWALTWQWADNDPRRSYIRRGEIAPDADYDILAWLPLDCSVEQAAAYVERAVRGHPREDIKRLTERLQHYNQTTAVDENWTDVEAAVMTKAEDLGKKATPRSRGVDLAAAAAAAPNGSDSVP